jgi:hypothetical protein
VPGPHFQGLAVGARLRPVAQALSAEQSASTRHGPPDGLDVAAAHRFRQRLPHVVRLVALEGFQLGE